VSRILTPRAPPPDRMLWYRMVFPPGYLPGYLPGDEDRDFKSRVRSTGCKSGTDGSFYPVLMIFF
jgi:hypothetical protein